MQKDLVSIITPCYNTGDIINRLLDSVLEQNYPLIEMLVVDDGSTDNSREVILSYISLFEKRGYRLEYRYQSNQGQSAAINNALKWVNGEYMVWPDSDDFYSRPDAISAFVTKLQELNLEFSAVRCFPTYVNEENVKTRLEFERIYCDYNQFYNCLYSENFIWPPGNYMVRTFSFDMVNSSREIYVEKNAGQNWQMLLPLLYSFKCYTINESYFNVFERSNSHSRGFYRTFDQKLLKISSYENTILNTLDKIHEIPELKKEEFKRNVCIKYLRERLDICLKHNRKHEAQFFVSELIAQGIKITSKERMLITIINVPFLYDFLRFIFFWVKRLVK